MVSLHGFSILILLTQSNHKSALLFSCTRPFSGAYAHYIPLKRKCQTYVRIFLENSKIFFGVIHKPKENGRDGRKNAPNCYNESPTAARKRRSASGSARTPFRGGTFCRCVFFLFRSFGNGGLILPFERLCFGLFLGVSLSAAARSAPALVYDKLTPNCHLFLNVI